MKGSQESLTTVVVKSWPTPATMDHKDTGENVDMEKVAAKSKLAGVVAVHGLAVPASSSTDGSRQGLWRTPDTSDRRSDKSRQVGLSNQTKTWPTPSADGDSRPGANADPVKWQQIADAKKAQGINKQLFLTTKVAMQQSGKLNPRWVETLMGLSVGWTMPSCASPVTIERMNSDCSVTVLSQQRHTERFARSSES